MSTVRLWVSIALAFCTVYPRFGALRDRCTIKKNAVAAAQECRNCRPMMKGSRGCRKCMGTWFAELLIREQGSLMESWRADERP